MKKEISNAESKVKGNWVGGIITEEVFVASVESHRFTDVTEAPRLHLSGRGWTMNRIKSKCLEEN